MCALNIGHGIPSDVQNMHNFIIDFDLTITCLKKASVMRFLRSTKFVENHALNVISCIITLIFLRQIYFVANNCPLNAKNELFAGASIALNCVRIGSNINRFATITVNIALRYNQTL